MTSLNSKELLEQLVTCVQDATDSETGVTNCALLMEEVLDFTLNNNNG